jgi:hypothetical protein
MLGFPSTKTKESNHNEIGLSGLQFRLGYIGNPAGILVTLKEENMETRNLTLVRRKQDDCVLE